MESEYHKQVRLLVTRFGKRLLKERIVFKVKLAKEPLTIKSPINPSRYHIEYKPDVRFVFQNKQQLAFEILDSQIEAKTIADLVRCVYSEAVTDVLFIVKNATKRDKVLNAMRVILDCFDDDLNLNAVEKKHNKTPLESHVEVITLDEIKHEEKVYKNLMAYIKPFIPK